MERRYQVTIVGGGPVGVALAVALGQRGIACALVERHAGLERFPPRTTYRVLRPELKGYWQFFGRVDVGEGWFFHSPVPKHTSPDAAEVHRLTQSAAGFPFPAVFE